MKVKVHMFVFGLKVGRECSYCKKNGGSSSIKKVLLIFLKTHRKTPVPEPRF